MKGRNSHFIRYPFPEKQLRELPGALLFYTLTFTPLARESEV